MHYCMANRIFLEMRLKNLKLMQKKKSSTVLTWKLKQETLAGATIRPRTKDQSMQVSNFPIRMWRNQKAIIGCI